MISMNTLDHNHIHLDRRLCFSVAAVAIMLFFMFGRLHHYLLQSLYESNYYHLGVPALVAVYVVGGVAWLGLGDWALDVIRSQTRFVPATMLCVMLVISLLEHNHAVSAGFIMADNKIPFFIPSLASGAVTVLLLWIFLGPLHWGIWGLILAPGFAQLAYQNWKWPSVVINELWRR